MHDRARTVALAFSHASRNTYQRDIASVTMHAAVTMMILAMWSWAPAIAAEGIQLSEAQPAASIDNIGSSPMAALGKRLFTDVRLSDTGEVSCATCHVPQKAFSDGLSIAVGSKGQRGTRNTPSLWNVSVAPNVFWDGRRATLEEQALDPLLNPREHGISDIDAVVLLVSSDPEYQAAFHSAFSLSTGEIKSDHIAAALAAFERTLISNASAFDRYYYQGETAALSASAIRGLSLFQGRARCATCHTIEGKHASFTDHQFHSLGINFEAILSRLANIAQRVATTDRRTLDRLISEDADIATLGRFIVTKDPRDIGKFRTPSLRNVALTAPYMHDGSAATLEAAIDSEIYYRSLEENRPIILTPQEKVDLVALLNALTSSNARGFP